jgi:hypothetical protein
MNIRAGLGSDGRVMWPRLLCHSLTERFRYRMSSIDSTSSSFL